MEVLDLPKVRARVRFPLPAPKTELKKPERMRRAVVFLFFVKILTFLYLRVHDLPEEETR